MKLFTDYHLHPQAHQHQPYTAELLQPWAEACRQKGLTDFAFTDHDRYHAGIDFVALEAFREANPDLHIRAGLELDNDPVTSAAGRAWVAQHWAQLDFVLGSVHYLTGEPLMFDSANQATQFERLGSARAYELYLNELEKMITQGHIDCLAHLDLIKIHKFRHPSQAPATFFEPILQKILQAGLALEINTAGWRKPVAEQYPERTILQRAVALGIPITLSSDAHSFAQVGEAYERVPPLLQEAGLTHVATFHQHRLTLVPLH
jgi:histidinol-phosphatase (PHP family)